MTPRPRGGLINRTTLLLLIAAAGMVMAAQARFLVSRMGWEAYLTVLLLLVVGLASLASPRRR